MWMCFQVRGFTWVTPALTTTTLYVLYACTIFEYIMPVCVSVMLIFTLYSRNSMLVHGGCGSGKLVYDDLFKLDLGVYPISSLLLSLSSLFFCLQAWIHSILFNRVSFPPSHTCSDSQMGGCDHRPLSRTPLRPHCLYSGQVPVRVRRHGQEDLLRWPAATRPRSVPFFIVCFLYVCRVVGRG